nr:immunoglobulin heavy chain junction region [Macaca mulatta]MOV47494.1 immunoglobulin heavy chain junction region [Macaca mulatta]MOV47528.1 immunoglobulin heavy chain junction region [Macaca mulatta]MOV47635.1 immunoglobulin heavy chain junction region [Macaca mulatta]MOV47644.1 immunoglobulin heavy chain junction region [Macaca mulatta]
CARDRGAWWGIDTGRFDVW